MKPKRQAGNEAKAAGGRVGRQEGRQAGRQKKEWWIKNVDGRRGREEKKVNVLAPILRN
jgi:hypothetical protein